MHDPLVIAGRVFSSRLLLGTGKFPSNAAMAAAVDASGTEIVTVALRRVELADHRGPGDDILDALDPSRVLVLTNTSGAQDADEAGRLAPLGRAARVPHLVKLQGTPQPPLPPPHPGGDFRARAGLGRGG